MDTAAPFRLTPPHVYADEDRLHEDVADALDKLLAPPAEWSTFPAGHTPLEPRYGAKLERMGLKPGWPDILVQHQGSFGLELKTQNGRLTRTRLVRNRRGGLRQVTGQEEMFPRLQRAGMKIAICRSVDDVLAALEGWGVPLRRRS